MEDESGAQLGFHSIAPYMENIASKQNLRDFSYIVRPDAKAGGCSGVLNRVVLRGKKRDGSDVSFALVYKDQPSDAFRREQFRTGDFFANEAVFYNVVIPAFDRLQEKKEIQSSERFVSFPRPFFAGEVVILEDMSALGYKLANRTRPLDVAHCSLVMRKLGILHAFSFALRDQEPEVFARIKASVTETWVVPPVGEILNYWANSTKRTYKKYIEMSPANGKYADALKRYCDNCYPAMVRAVDGEKADPYSVISHGDCWTNNYLFKYSEESGLPEELCMLDFQLTRYSSPACDLMYFISCCTDKQTRAQHLDQFLETYHRSLSSFLLKLGSDPERLFPFSA